MGEIATFEYGYTTTAGEQGEFRYIRITDIDDYGNISDKDKKYANLLESKDKEKYLLKENNIIMARIGSVGKTALFESNEKAIFASYLIRINLNKEIILPKYYWYFTKSQEYWEQVEELVKGTIQPQFNANSLKEILMSIPNLTEQEKVIIELEQERKIVIIQKEIIDYFKHKEEKVLNNLWHN
nr:restriction endonuclease subunit S [endosymbiont GvMRE of Glomus versiforme]